MLPKTHISRQMVFIMTSILSITKNSKWRNFTMTKLKWDQVGERLYETGVRNCVLYQQAAAGTYPKGVAWNGITGITQSPTGADANPLYADDIKYLNLRAVEEEEGTIEAYTYPPEFAECDGSAELATGVMIHQQPRKAFGLCYRTVLGNDTEFEKHGYKLHLIYGATASPSEKAYETINDSPDAITFSWDYTTTPVEVEGFKPTSSIEIDSTKVNAEKLAALEAVLYGTDGSGGTEGTDARLPLPAEIATLLA
jgi:hypothetical protein